jgi:ribose-phosphate pyrophosphokinase
MTDTRASSTILYYEEDRDQACALAKQLTIPSALIQRHVFPDQESCIRVPTTESDQIILFQSLDHPNNKLIELMLACETLHARHQPRIILVAPYLCYMRQDTAFQPGDAVSQHIVGRYLARLVDTLITVDPHLHRTPTLEQAVPVSQAICLSSAELQADYIRQHYQDCVLVGPDSESEQWVAAVAAQANLPYVIASKNRLGDRHVEITIPHHERVNGRTAILLDDIASSGQTLATCAEVLKQSGAQSIHAIVTHALFQSETETLLHNAGIEQVFSTDSIRHPSNAISLQPLLANTLETLLS